MTYALYLCDWLPPDFGAVGQYALRRARARAATGSDVLLLGLSSAAATRREEPVATGRLRIWKLHADAYDRGNRVARLLWTLKTNLALLWAARRELLACDEIVFTGSPPFLVHFLVPLNAVLRKRLVYRITDFHPECLIAELGRTPLPLGVLRALTEALRRQVDCFEVLGEDQRRRLDQMGIAEDRVRLVPDDSPVAISPGAEPLPLPENLIGHPVILYSGNLGVAHEYETFLGAYRRHCATGGRVRLWLNATGARADALEAGLRRENLPYHRSHPIPLDQLGRLMVTPAAHLITLRDAFVGYVLPSKVHACIASRRPILFIGSQASDVDRLCCRAGLSFYARCSVGDIAAVEMALDRLGSCDRSIRDTKD